MFKNKSRCTCIIYMLKGGPWCLAKNKPLLKTPYKSFQNQTTRRESIFNLILCQFLKNVLCVPHGAIAKHRMLSAATLSMHTFQILAFVS
jgi:hypothetical protein